MKPIPGYEGRYSVTEDGRVYSHARFYPKLGRRGKDGFLNQTDDKDGYKMVSIHRGGKQKCMRVHQLVAITYLGYKLVDHKDRNPANNHVSNLRPVTNSLNRANSKMSVNNKSGYRGVWWRKDRGCWCALIYKDNKPIRLGSYQDKEEAARAFDKASVELFGEYAFKNFP